MTTTQNIRMPGVIFYHGMDATADLLNASQQFLSTEISERTKDLMAWAGFSWGLRIAAISGQTVTLTKGTAFDKFGSRLLLSLDNSYGVKPPILGTTSFYLCVKGTPVTTQYKVHPYDGSRQPIEQAVGLEFFSDSTVSFDLNNNVYSSDGTGLVIAKLSVSGSSYVFVDDTTNGNRSPVLKMRDGS